MYAAYTPTRYFSCLPGDEDNGKTNPGKLLSISSTFRVLIAAALGMTAILALVPAAGHDQLWFLLLSQRWLHGATLYGPQAFDSNTPAILWLGAVPVLVAEHLHLPIPAVAKKLFLLLEAGVALFSHRILRRGMSVTEPQSLFLGFAFLVLFAVVPARDLGQRDPLAGLLCLPYILMAAVPRSWQSNRAEWGHRIASVLLAGLAFCLKPQLGLIALAMEAALPLSPRAAFRPAEDTPVRGRFRVEPAILLACGALFYLAIRLFAPLYLTVAVPTVLSTYWAIGHLNAVQLLCQAAELHVLAAVTLAVYALRPRTRLVTLLLLAAMAALGSYYLQGTGWYYQQLPAISLFGLALAVQLTPLIPSCLLVARAFSLFPAGLAVLALTLTWHFSGYSFKHFPTEDERYAISTPDPTFFTTLPAGSPVATFTTSVDDAMMPVFRYRLTWAQRTNNLWTLPAVLRTQSPAGFPIPASHRLSADRLAALAAQQRGWMVEDLSHWRPVLVLVARCQDPGVTCQELEDRTGHQGDNLLAFFLEDPSFATLWHAHYLYQRSSGPYDAYTRIP